MFSPGRQSRQWESAMDWATLSVCPLSTQCPLERAPASSAPAPQADRLKVNSAAPATDCQLRSLRMLAPQN